MTVFGRYATYYDLFYQEKNYHAEVDYINVLIRKHATSPATTIIDLGCGTGGHALLLAQQGYSVTGIDRSAVMLASAREKNQKMQVAAELIEGDICTLKLGKSFDVAIAMFAVMGYQTANKMLEAALINIHEHLNKNGLLIFDGWFGPAVLKQEPRDKMLVVKKGSAKIIRFTQAELDILRHTVKVRFSMLKIENDACESLEETHTMRFFFPKELEYVLEKTGFRLLRMYPFMKTKGPLTENEWNMTVVAQKTSS